MTSSIHSQLSSKQLFSTHYKTVFIGQHCVGKTSILSQYMNKTFIQNYIPTIGLGYHIKEVKLPQSNNYLLSFELWDTSSFEKAEVINLQILQEANIIVMTYDITRKETLEYLKKYHQNSKIPEHALLVVVCNKIDKQDETENNDSQGREFAKSINAIFHSTSAKTSAGIKQLFNIIGKKIIQSNNSEEYFSEETNGNNSGNETPKKIVFEPKRTTTNTNDGENNKDKKCIIV